MRSKNSSSSTKTSSWNNDKPIICLIRHSSPIERFFSRSTIEKLMRYNPSSQLKIHSKIEDAKDLLKVEIGKGWMDVFFYILESFCKLVSYQPFVCKLQLGLKQLPIIIILYQVLKKVMNGSNS